MNISLKSAVNKLVKELKKDKDLYYCWQSNIAMSFLDDPVFKTFERGDLHLIANRSAKRFLDLLIK